MLWVFVFEIPGEQLAFELVEVDREFANLLGGNQHAAQTEYRAGFVHRMFSRNILAHVAKLIQISNVLSQIRFPHP